MARSDRTLRSAAAAVVAASVVALLGSTAALAPVAVAAPQGAVRPQSTVPSDPALNKAIAKLMADPSVTASGTRVGLIVADGTDRHAIYSRLSTTALIPASTLKLFTAAAGLTYLGSGYRWATEGYVSKAPVGGVLSGNVVLKGLGDPTLLESDLAAMAQTFKAKGLTRVTGQVLADASFFDNVRYNGGWSGEYLSEYYAAQVCGLTLAPDTDYDAGTIILNYAPGATAGSPAKVTVTPASATSYVSLVNRTTTSSSGTGTTLEVKRTAGTNTITLTGTVGLRRPVTKAWVTVNDPALLAATVFRAQLVRAGIRVDGGVARGTVPAGATRWTSKDSMTLGQLLTPFLKLSNNGHAEVITKTLGRRYGRPGNWSDGIAHLRKAAAAYGVPLTGVTFVDGSGLSRNNRMTTAALVTLVGKVQSASWFGTFKAALPVAGTQPVRWTGGTLATRMVGTPAAGRLRAKNGNLTAVTSLAGYVPGADGRPFIFAMVSYYTGASLRPVEDRLGALLGGWKP